MGSVIRLTDRQEEFLKSIDSDIKKALDKVVTNGNIYRGIDYDFLSDEIARKVAEKLGR